MNWSDFEAAAAALASAGRERFLRTRVALLGTLRRDGSPRISPVEPYLVVGELLFGLMRSPKADDLSRDPRCTLHSSVSDLNGSEGEFKLYGRAVPVSDPSIRGADPNAWWMAFPPGAGLVFAMDVESAALVEWGPGEGVGTHQVTTWSRAAGLRRSSAPYP